MNTFKEGNEGIKKYEVHKFNANKSRLRDVCDTYWTGYMKAWRPWKPAEQMFPSASTITMYAEKCEDKDSANSPNWDAGLFLFPDDDTIYGNRPGKDCNKYLDLIAKIKDVSRDEVEVQGPTAGKPCVGITGKVFPLKDGYCIGDRVGLGADKVHGTGNPSLVACGNFALTDPRCKKTGYFDAEEQGNSFQCKCSTGDCVQPSNPTAQKWKIYHMEHAYSGDPPPQK